MKARKHAPFLVKLWVVASVLLMAGSYVIRIEGLREVIRCLGMASLFAAIVMGAKQCRSSSPDSQE